MNEADSGFNSRKVLQTPYGSYQYFSLTSLEDAGLIDISKGEILVDNKNIINNKKSWNNIIGYVPQTVFLNDESFAENIYFYQY